jgi:hypothetical protein
MGKVALMMRDKKLPLETQTKIIKYLQFVWRQEQRDDPEYEDFIMNKLSFELKDEIYLHTNVKYLKKIPAFQVFSEKTLISLARHMKKVRFCPEEHIYKVFFFME